MTQIPETPKQVEQLDLMQRLNAYARGEASWQPDGAKLGPEMRNEYALLHANLIHLVDHMLAPLLDRITAREMETFTMHDRMHGQKVAHLMWHILRQERRETLTPPEIGMMVAAAYLHDVGMALSPSERAARLEPTSDLWDRLEIQDSAKEMLNQLRAQVGNPNAHETVKRRAEQKIAQAEEALLSQDTRERHALPERYREVFKQLNDFHEKDRARVPDIESCLSFDGDSFRAKLIAVCVSHNQDAETLVQRDEHNPAHPRFPSDYPVGRCNADLHMIAAALRLADILDFDRERTPSVLFHYLLPGNLDPQDNRSVLEWGKHLTISNWQIEPDAIVFRGRSKSHILHHAVVQFCAAIAQEIQATRATFGALQEVNTFPFALLSEVKPEIHEEGYHYVPYQFELDDERVYNLLMGGAIYDNPLVAVRELVQNAVDACKLRDSLSEMADTSIIPNTTDRIFIRYEEPMADCPQPKLIVTDTGTGMDALIIDRYFLKVGRSYYNSSEFNQYRIQLRKSNLDFAPVSEFGIGFLSCFLLAGRVEVETAMWESVRGDTYKRTLQIDGPTRLIRLDEQSNQGVRRFKGTRITLYMTRGAIRNSKIVPPNWNQVKNYLIHVCQELPYRLNLEYVADAKTSQEWIDPLPLKVELPSELETIALRIPLNDEEAGLEGEIALLNPYLAKQLEESATTKISVSLLEDDIAGRASNTLLRGGFRIGGVPGLPDTFLFRSVARARLRLKWESRKNRRYISPKLARENPANEQILAEHVVHTWLKYFLEHVEDIPAGQLYYLQFGRRAGVKLETCAWLEEYDALRLYQLAKQGWHFMLQNIRNPVSDDTIEEWESGKGKSLWLGSMRDDLHDALLDLVMPRVTTLQMGTEARFYGSPDFDGKIR